MALFIWMNSLVPGEGSSSLSLAVVAAIQGALGAVGLPSAWVTNLLVRKTAHFLEYALLAVLVSRAIDPRGGLGAARAAWIAAMLVFVPSVDECIQLSVPGRSGQLSDVLLDCCGGAAGALACWAIGRLRAKKGAGRKK